MKEVDQGSFISFINSNSGTGLEIVEADNDRQYRKESKMIAYRTKSGKYFIKEQEVATRMHDMDFYELGYCESCGEVEAPLYITDDEETAPMCELCAKEWEGVPDATAKIKD